MIVAQLVKNLSHCYVCLQVIAIGPCLQADKFNPNDKGSMVLRNVGNILTSTKCKSQNVSSTTTIINRRQNLKSISKFRQIQSNRYNLTAVCNILISFSHLQLCIPSGHIPSGLLNKILYAFISSMRAAFSAHLIVLELVTLSIFGDGFHPSVSSAFCLLGPNIFLGTLFSDIFNTLCSSLNIRIHISNR